VLVVRGEDIETNPEQVEHLLQGWFQALRYLEEHPAEAMIRMSPRLGTSPAELAASLEELRLPSFQENLALLQGPSSPLLESARKVQRFMLTEGLMYELVRPEQMLDARPLESLQENGR